MSLQYPLQHRQVFRNEPVRNPVTVHYSLPVVTPQPNRYVRIYRPELRPVQDQPYILVKYIIILVQLAQNIFPSIVIEIVKVYAPKIVYVSLVRRDAVYKRHLVESTELRRPRAGTVVEDIEITVLHQVRPDTFITVDFYV